MLPAESLTGLVVGTGWKVVGIAHRPKGATGACFSVGYNVQHNDGRLAFLKAMDYTRAFQVIQHLAAILHSITEAYLFEKNLCLRCRDEKLQRVVHAIECGTVQLKPNEPLSAVEFLVFERADADIRTHLDAMAAFDLAFALRTLHHVAVGLQQLHRIQVAHQDVKPSNVLVFSGSRGSKIGDLGRAWVKDTPAPHDVLNYAGDPTYAPPELLYGQVSADERARRFGCDLYHLGNLAVFIFSRAHINALLWKYLAPEHQAQRWSGDYPAVLPYVHAAFAQAMEEFKNNLPSWLQEDLTAIVMQLCEPDVSRRGHPLSILSQGNQFSLERYISAFDRLAYQAEITLRAKVA